MGEGPTLVAVTDPASIVAGRYRLVERIGAGAMGVVWLAHDERLGRTVALKQLILPAVFTPALASADRGADRGAADRGADLGAVQAGERMMREGRIAARLHHPNAISVFDVIDHGGRPWLVMEYLPSRSLATVLTERATLPPREVAAIGRQLADALAAAHAAGIVHRDVKPANVLLGDGGVVKLTDFGISRAVGDDTVTRTGMLAGTPAYLAPEVARGAEPSPAADVFAFGATLYAAVEGQPPFGADHNALALLHQVAGGQVLPPQRAGPLTALLMQLLRADPAERPTMAHAAAALRAMVDGAALPAGGLSGGVVGFDDAAASNDTAITGPIWSGRTAAPDAPYTMVGLPSVGELADETADEPSRRTPLLIAGGVALAVLAGLLLLAATMGPARPAAQAPAAQTPTGPATSAPPVTTTTVPPTTTTTPPTAADLQRAVIEYYALLPGNPQAAWARLGPTLQAKGFNAYQTFWSGVDSVQAVPAKADPATMTVRVFVVYRRGDHRPLAEAHDLVLISSGGTLLIDRDSKVAGAIPTTTRKRRG
jgi:eukaryotic-like serine/threonine-protein kinase